MSLYSKSEKYSQVGNIFLLNTYWVFYYRYLLFFTGK